MSTKRAAVLGKPIEHSLSPTIHNLVYAELGLDWPYEKFEVGEGELAGFLNSCSTDFAGFSVTMPLKTEAYAVAVNLDSFAERTGAVNTLVRTDDGWNGFNTDVPGAISAMRERSFPALKNAKVLGAGATARSLIVAASDLGFTDFDVYARRLAGFQELQNSLPDFNLVFIELHEEAEIQSSTSEILLNSLPGTAADSLNVHANGYLFDVTYSPWPTKLSEHFDPSKIVNGKDLLIHQALFQVELMTGVEVRNEPTLLQKIRLALTA